MPDLGLFDLVGPYFLEGTDFGPALHPLLSALFIVEMDTAFDEESVAIWGKARIDKTNLAQPSFAWGSSGLQLTNTGGAEATHTDNHMPLKDQVFDLHDVTIDFRLTVPRLPAPVIAGAQALLNADTNLIAALGEFGSSTVAPSDYPGIQFRLDLLATVITLHLPFLTPAKLDPSGILMALDSASAPDVKLILPKLLFTITQSSADGSVSVKLDSWGAETIDDPDDRGEGQLIQMVPPYAFIGSERYLGFGFDKAIIDLSDDHTPPEILSHFGAGDDWQGIYLPEVRVFVAPSGVEGLAFDVAARDLLLGIGDSAGVSGDFELDIINQGSKPEIRVIFAVKDTGEVITAETQNGLGRVPVPADTDMQLFVDINNGYAPYTVTVTIDDAPLTMTNQRANIHLMDDAIIVVTVTDSSPAPHTSEVSILAFMRASKSSAGPVLATLPSGDIELDPDPATSNGKSIRITGRSDADITLSFAPNEPGTTVTVDGVAQMLSSAGTLTVPRSGQWFDRQISAQWPAPAAASNVNVTAWFHFDMPPEMTTAAATTTDDSKTFWKPYMTSLPPPVGTPESTYVVSDPGTNVSSDEDVTTTTRSVPFTSASAFIKSAPFTNFVTQLPDGAAIAIKGFSSYEHHDDQAPHNLQLSQRRGVALAMIIAKYLKENAPSKTASITVLPEGNTTADPLLPDGHAARDQFGTGFTPAPGYRSADYWRADGTYSLSSAGTATTINARLIRPHPIPDIPEPRTAPPKQGNPGRPAFFHRIKFLLRVAQGTFIAFEINGEVDFQTPAEDRLRDAAPADNPHKNETPTLGETTKLPGASADPNANPQDGVVDFDLIISHDDAAGVWREQLTIGAGKNDKDGLFRWGSIAPQGTPVPPAVFWRDVLGMYIVLAPLLDRTAAAQPSGGDVVTLVVEAAIPFGLAALDWVHTEAITLYGGELVVRERDTGTDASLLFDVESALWLNVKLGSVTLLKCKPELPVKVRYKAVGFRLNFSSTEHKPTLEPVFDSSKGFSIDVPDPGTFQVPEPLGSIVQVLGARIARTNPLNIELDIGTKANLGVVSVDRAKVRLPLDPLGPPTLTALGASVNIPGAVKGSGYLDLSGAGITGKIDLQIVPIKLRVSAGVSLQPADGATGVLIALEVDFPAPIVLANSGLGIFGLLGLFGMHFHRLENPAGLPTPALDWFMNVAHGDATDVTHGWGPLRDHWSFGVGSVLGTLEGGVVINLKGVLILELPGPRLLLFMKANVLDFTGRPGLKDPSAQGTILATIDLDFARGTLSIGLAIDWKVDPLIEIAIPADAFFDFNDQSNFALDIGTYSHPAVASVFKKFRADGYLEIRGNGITDVPPLGPLSGFAIALGLHVSLVWGNEHIGLYLKAGASLDAGIGFSPFRLVGKVKIDGELHLFVVGIGASGELDVESDSHDTRITGKICGEVDCFFFSISGCVGFSLGTSPPPPAAPPLVRGMYLQSRSPALVVGTGTDRPIDGSLGNATTLDKPAAPTVPIDSVPVLQFECAPGLDAAFTSFTQSPGTAPNRPADGWCKRGEYYYRYVLTSIAIAGPPLLNDAAGTPSVWRSRNAAPSGDDTSIDLGLLDWMPTATPNAVQSSTELDEQIEHRWSHVCGRVAGQASVLWTFQHSALGPSRDGWDLVGTAWPDPPGTYRSTSPPLGLHVREAWRTGDPLFDALLPIEPGRVIGLNVPCTHVHAPELPPPPIPVTPIRLASLLPPSVISAHALAAAEVAADASSLTSASARLCPSRVLEAPFANDPPQGGGFFSKLVDEAEKKIPYADLGDAIVIDGQPLEEIRLLLLVPAQVIKPSNLVLRALDEHDASLGDQVITEKIVSQWTDLPPQWRTAGPWFHDVDLGWQFLSLTSGAGTNAPQRYVRVLADVKLPVGTARIVLGIKDWPRIRSASGLFSPSFLVAAIEGFSVAEVRRSDYDTTVITDDQKRLEGALSGDPAKLPLFTPASDYTITVQYTAEIGRQNGGGVVSLGAPAASSQALHFHTDDAPPPRLDPWLLCIVPSGDEGFHFYLDPIIVVFATDAVTELFGAYGKHLRGIARAASFRPPVTDPNYLMTVAAVLPLTPIAGHVFSPWEEAVRALGSVLAPCIDTSGVSVKHARKVFDLFLDPLTSYVFDIETDPPPAIPNPVPDGYIVKPLYRSAFTTSRYPHVEELASDVGASLIDHRPCPAGASAAIAGLPDAPTDAQIDDALRAAAVGILERPKHPAITVLWEAAAPYAVPFAVVIDAPEPLRRSRTEPTAAYGDPTRPTRVTEWDLAPNVWLDVVEAVSGVPNVTRVVAAPGGARIIVQLAPGVVGRTLDVQLKRSRRKPIEDVDADDAIPIFSIPLSRAPWDIGP